jgi:azurin
MIQKKYELQIKTQADYLKYYIEQNQELRRELAALKVSVTCMHVTATLLCPCMLSTRCMGVVSFPFKESTLVSPCYEDV